MEYIVRKVLNTKIFPRQSDGKAWKESVIDRDFEILFVSQFTLFAIVNGNTLDFHKAMPPGPAKEFYSDMVRRKGVFPFHLMSLSPVKYFM